MERIWLKHYPAGIPAEVDTQAHASLNAMFEASCRKFGTLPAFSNLGGTLTYAQLDERSQHFATFLLRRAGVKKGDRVAIMLPNLLQYPVAMFGALRAGAAVVNVNPMYTARELQYQLQDSGAKVIVVLENFAHTLEEVKGRTPVETIITTQVGDLLPMPKALITNLLVKYVKKMVPPWTLPSAISLLDALGEGAAQPATPVSVTLHDVAFLQYTGGTTGVPKGAVLTHGNMVANLEQAAAWIGSNLIEGAETFVAPLPLYHVLALTVNLIFVRIGAHSVLITNPRDLPAFIKELSRHAFTGILGVNTLFNALLNAPDFAKAVSPKLKLAFGGGAAIQRHVAERWQQLTGVPLIEGYGLTESSPIVTANPLTIKSYTGTIGVPIPSTDVAILDDDGNEQAIGVMGEICVRGPQVMKGYWNKPEETEKVITPQGWLRTGDIGVMDSEGYVKIVDRKKDLVIVSGFKVFPTEIEEIVCSHPGVLEAGVIGIPDEKTGEAVKVFAVKKDPTLTEQTLLEHCRKQLTGYKVPKFVEFRDALPKSNIGKILRRVLKEEELKKSSVAVAA